MKNLSVTKFLRGIALAGSLCLLLVGCGGNSSANYGVGLYGGSGGWGSSFSVGISNHHYRSPHRYGRGRR